MGKMVEKQIAYCGIVCSDCRAYIATQKNDDKLRQVEAEQWTKMFNHPYKMEDINCNGCIGAGVRMGYCSMCEIRKCGSDKGVINCAYCAGYPCAKLDVIYKHAPEVKKTLDAIKKGKK
jgi:hypothetical protein